MPVPGPGVGRGVRADGGAGADQSPASGPGADLPAAAGAHERLHRLLRRLQR